MRAQNPRHPAADDQNVRPDVPLQPPVFRHRRRVPPHRKHPFSPFRPCFCAAPRIAATDSVYRAPPPMRRRGKNAPVFRRKSRKQGVFGVCTPRRSQQHTQLRPFFLAMYSARSARLTRSCSTGALPSRCRAVHPLRPRSPSAGRAAARPGAQGPSSSTARRRRAAWRMASPCPGRACTAEIPRRRTGIPCPRSAPARSAARRPRGKARRRPQGGRTRRCIP